jgi:hypothetical protein
MAARLRGTVMAASLSPDDDWGANSGVVVPAKAGTRVSAGLAVRRWIPAFAGMTIWHAGGSIRSAVVY